MLIRALLAWFVVSIGVADAAQVKLLSPTPIPLSAIADGSCTLSISGEIKNGDAQLVAQVLEDARLSLSGSSVQFRTPEVDDGIFLFGAGQKEPGGDSSLVPLLLGERYRIESGDVQEGHGLAVCLSGPGGDFAEAIEIIKILQPLGYATVVPENAVCLSACAFIFLAGDIVLRGETFGEIAPFRVLHVSATLGFHAPRGDLKGLAPVMPIDWLNRQVEFALGIMRNFESLFLDRDSLYRNKRLPRDLFSEILVRFDPDDFFYIDTINKAGRFNIRLAGVPAIQIDETSLPRLCYNINSWDRALIKPFAPSELLDEPQFLTFPPKQICNWGKCSDQTELITVVKYGGPAESSRLQRFCKVTYAFSDVGDDLFVQHWMREWTITSQIGQRRPIEVSVEPWASLPHYLPLKRLNSLREPIVSHQNAYLLNGLWDDVFPTDGEGRFIMGYENETFDPFLLLLWPNGRGYFGWLSDTYSIQSALQGVAFDRTSGEVCIERDGGISDCSQILCQQGSGCVFRPRGRPTLDGFPYISRPIYFPYGKTNEYLAALRDHSFNLLSASDLDVIQKAQ